MFAGTYPKYVWNHEYKRWDAIPADDSHFARTLAAAYGLVELSRIVRKHYSIPRIGLREKLTEEKLQKIAKLANAKYVPGFGDHLLNLILDAHKDDAMYRGSTAKKTKEGLKKVQAKARELIDALKDIDVGSPAEYPGLLLEIQLEKVHFKEQSILIPDLIEVLHLLNHAAGDAKPQKRKET